ncbi:EAL domain-containing protein [Aurantimonas sp. 22II-16-19i]|uniref:putative bifunctional diguanylate cyclase/phosphodiesterase n=1 Tax=Aurantimonas sp. 22II-16-19i TaxID=1317114 RepID=UPI0009F98CD5|nr:EAL domain-containing protein [Aurantimonas sp. 22II-16-19i]
MRIRKLAAWFRLHDADCDLVMAQFEELRRQVPLLYALLAVNAVALAYTHFGYAPNWMTILVPATLVIASLARLVVWIVRRRKRWDADHARRELRKTHILAAILAAAYVAWALSLNAYGGADEHAHVAIFIAVTVIGCILCLASFPQAALSVTFIVTIPYLAYYLSVGNVVYTAVGLNMSLVTAVMVQVMLNNFSGFRQLVISKGVTDRLSRENLRMAHTDALTALPNRRNFFEALRAGFARAREDGSPLAVGIIDLDHFKAVNDSYGHLLGDRLLEAVAERLRQFSGPDLTMARLGGDEFAFVIEGGETIACSLAGDACASLAEPFEIGNLCLVIGASCGVALLTEDVVDAHDMFDRADYVLYSSKVSNRGHVTVYSPAHARKIHTTRQLEMAMSSADLEAEMSICLQPIVNTVTGEATAVEALARWHSPILGHVPPDSFIAVAERSGQMHDLTLLLLRKALTLVDRLPETMRLSFNLSAHDITSAPTMISLVALVRSSGVDPARLIFEVTETAVIRDFKTAEASIRLLRSLGSHIALDDFGTGYSSLSYLHRLPIDRVKIDRSFMPGYETEAGRNLLGSILALCLSMKLNCIAEGVEEAAQVTTLRDLGYVNFQGYFYARPMTIDALEVWLTERDTAPVRPADGGEGAAEDADRSSRASV